GVGRLGQLAELGQVVGDRLAFAQALGELRQDAAGQRDVAGGHVDAGGGGERLHDRQQRAGGQGRGFVGQGVDDLGGLGHVVSHVGGGGAATSARHGRHCRACGHGGKTARCSAVPGRRCFTPVKPGGP